MSTKHFANAIQHMGRANEYRYFQARLVGILIDHAGDDRHHYDLQIEGKTPILQIIQIVLDALLDGRVTSQSVYLSPSRYPYFEGVSIIVARNFLQEFVDKMRSLRSRAHNAHIAFQHINKLR